MRMWGIERSVDTSLSDLLTHMGHIDTLFAMCPMRICRLLTLVSTRFSKPPMRICRLLSLPERPCRRAYILCSISPMRMCRPPWRVSTLVSRMKPGVYRLPTRPLKWPSHESTHFSLILATVEDLAANLVRARH